MVFIKSATVTKVTRDGIDSQLFYMDWSGKALKYFDSLTRHVFLPMLSADQYKGVSSDKLLDIVHRMMNLNQVMCGKAEVGNILLHPPVGPMNTGPSFCTES